MSLTEPGHRSLPAQLIGLLTTLLHVSTPAFYTSSWRPWARYMLAGCIMVVLVVVVRVTNAWIASAPL